MIANNKQITAIKWKDLIIDSILTWSHQIDYPVSQNRKWATKAQSSPSQEMYWGTYNIKHRVTSGMSDI